MWGKVKTGGKTVFDKAYTQFDKLGAPVNKLSNNLGAEAFWPTTLDKESEKAARILRSFCKEGFKYEEPISSTPNGVSEKQRVIKKIPHQVIKNAQGLVIFTTMRTGLWASGAGGSGIIVGRLPDGSWSPPSGIMLHTVGLGFLVGVDIYDCVMVINTKEALQGFSKLRCTVGGELSAVAGPVGIGGVLESEVHKRQAPLFTYMKSRGFYAGVQIDGTIIIERNDENERFYGVKLGVGEILGGSVSYPPRELHTLFQTLKMAQGDPIDESELPGGAAPGDFELTPPTETLQSNAQTVQLFGIPDKYDPDPYGINELADSGFELKEAGTHKILSRESFIFNPSPSSPVFNAFNNRNSLDSRSMSRRSSWRTSTLSTATQTMDISTQTDFDGLAVDTPATSPYSNTSSGRNRMMDIKEHDPEETVKLDKALLEKKLEESPVLNGISRTPEKESVSEEEKLSTQDIPPTSTTSGPPTTHISEKLHKQLDADTDSDSEHEDLAVQTVQQVVTPRKTFMARANVVTVHPIRAPPILPPRNPIRVRKRPLVITGDNNSLIISEEQRRDIATSPMSTPLSHSNASVSSVDLSRQSSEESKNMSGAENLDRKDSASSLEKKSDEMKKGEKAVMVESDDDTDGEFHSVSVTPAVQIADPFATTST